VGGGGGGSTYGANMVGTVRAAALYYYKVGGYCYLIVTR
jgi:hypothetical protein